MAENRVKPKSGFNPIDPDRKETIIYHARNLFQERSFDGVNIREIMQLAEVTQPTIYYYFQNKDGLFLAVLLDILTEIDSEFNRASRESDFHKQLQIIAQAFMEPPTPNLPMLFGELKRRVEHNKHFPEQGLTPSQARSAFLYVNQTWPRSLENILRDARRAGEAALDDPGFTASYLLTILTAYPHSPFVNFRVKDKEQARDTLLNYLITMLRMSSASAQI